MRSQRAVVQEKQSLLEVNWNWETLDGVLTSVIECHSFHWVSRANLHEVEDERNLEGYIQFKLCVAQHILY